MALFGFLSIIISVALILVVIVQKSKGGGLSSTFGGGASQILGSRRSNEMIEKITWYLAAGLAVVAIMANIVGGMNNTDPNALRTDSQIDELIIAAPTQAQDPNALPTAPANEAPAPTP